MQKFILAVLATLLVPLVASAAPTFFPADAANDVNPDVQFGVLKAQPDAYRGRAIELAGRIVGTQETDKGVLILVKKLPVAEHPAYGPVEVREQTGEKFTVLYPGKVDSEGLWFGNKLMVIAVAQGNRAVTIPDGVARMAPYVVARCMHVWKTGEYGSYQISDFPHVTDGYYSLPQETYCVR